MNQVPTIGRFGQDSPGVPAQSGGPEQEQAADASAARMIGPVQIAVLAGAGLVVAGGLAWVLLGGSPDPAQTSTALPAASAAPSPTSSPQDLASPQPGPADAAGRNPFGGGVGVGGGSTAGAGGGAVPTITTTVTQKVTATVKVPVVSTVTATKTVTSDAVYVFLSSWDEGTQTGQFVVNSDPVTMGNGSTKNGISVTDDTAVGCVQVKLASAASSAAKTLCEGGSVRLR